MFAFACLIEKLKEAVIYLINFQLKVIIVCDGQFSFHVLLLSHTWACIN